MRFTGNVGAGEPGFMDFEYQGAYVPVIDGASLSASLAYDTTIAPAFLGASASVNFGASYTPKGLTAFALDSGNQITIGRDMSEASGIYGARVVSRKLSGMLEPEAVPVGTYNWFAKQRAGTAGSFTTGTIGGTAGNRWVLTVPRCFMRPITLQNRDGIRAMQVSFGVSGCRDGHRGGQPCSGAGADMKRIKVKALKDVVWFKPIDSDPLEVMMS